MDFGILDEGNAANSNDPKDIYRDVLLALHAAEDAGFDRFGVSEQHFWPPLGDIPRLASLTSPELFYAIAAATTKRIGLRTAITVLPYHHPLLLAERIATLDILSDGRLEFGTGRGNNFLAADAFQIPIEETHDRWEEALRIIVGAWTSEGEFQYDGRYFQIPPRLFHPKPMQKPHPKLFYSALSPQSHELAGRLGLGLMTATAGITLEKLERRIEIYRAAIKDPEPIGAQVNEFVSLTVLGMCAQTEEEARIEGEQEFINYYTAATLVYQETVARVTSGVDFESIKAKYTYDGMRDACMVISGTPDTWCDAVSTLEELGVDEVGINFCGVKPEAARRAIALLGDEVLPKFKGRVKVSA